MTTEERARAVVEAWLDAEGPGQDVCESMTEALVARIVAFGEGERQIETARLHPLLEDAHAALDPNERPGLVSRLQAELDSCACDQVAIRARSAPPASPETHAWCPQHGIMGSEMALVCTCVPTPPTAESAQEKA